MQKKARKPHVIHSEHAALVCREGRCRAQPRSRDREREREGNKRDRAFTDYGARSSATFHLKRAEREREKKKKKLREEGIDAVHMGNKPCGRPIVYMYISIQRERERRAKQDKGYQSHNEEADDHGACDNNDNDNDDNRKTTAEG